MKISDEKNEKNQSPVKTDEPGYDLTDMGDAPLLSVLRSDAGEDSPDDEPGKGEPDDKEEKDQDKDGETNKPDSVGMARKLMILASALIAGETLPEDLLPLLDAAVAHYEIQRARQEGELAGRNALIEERMAPAPIGVPDLNGAPTRSSSPASIFDLAREAKI